MTIPYLLEVDGKEVPMHVIRVSAAPINHFWPGRQRSINQSEDAWFANFDLPQDGREVELVVRLMQPNAEHVELRPHKYAPSFERNGNEVRFRLRKPGQFCLLVNGLHGALHLFANPPFVYQRRADDLYFGPGVHEAGFIMPKSGQRSCLDRGASVYGAIVVHKAEKVEIIGRAAMGHSPGNQEGVPPHPRRCAAEGFATAISPSTTFVSLGGGRHSASKVSQACWASPVSVSRMSSSAS